MQFNQTRPEHKPKHNDTVHTQTGQNKKKIVSSRKRLLAFRQTSTKTKTTKFRM